MNTFASKLVAVCLSIFILAYVGYQTYTSLYNPYESQIVKLETYSQDIDLNGFFVRNEKALDEKKQGVVSYRFNNAEKISKSTVIANVYEQESDLFNLKKIEQLNNDKQILVKSQDKQNIEGLKIDSLNAQINSNQDELIKIMDDNNLSKLNETYDTLLLNMNKLAVVLDNTVTYSTQIEAIDQQIAQLNSQISKNNQTVVSGESGYFSSSVDGYESVFTPAMLKKLSVAGVKDAIKKKTVKPSDSIGKIQYDSNWSFVALVEKSKAELFKEGQQIKLKFNSKSTKEIVVTVSQLIIEKDSKESVIVFTSDSLDPDLATMRFEQPKAVLAEYSGIVIPKDAVRFERIKEVVIDEETQTESTVDKDIKGVYTLLGKTVRFKRLDVVYEDSYYVISRVNNNAKYVSVYDKVITKGKNLNGTVK